MSITLLFGCAQIETSVRDLATVKAFMKIVLGAAEVEQQLAAEIGALFPKGELEIDHLDCGQAIFQINQPSPELIYRGRASVHQDYLDRIGPCVTNLNYFVDDAVHAHELLTSMGAVTHIQGPSSAARCLADYGTDNTRTGGDSRSFYFMGSRHLIGLDLEMMEPNFHHFTKQTVQYPCFVEPRPTASDWNFQVLRLRLVVRDLEETYKNLVKVFAPASRSNPYEIRKGSLAKSFRIGIGGIELEYCEPSSSGWLGEQLERFGPGVVTVEFGVQDLDLGVTRIQKSGASYIEIEDELTGDKSRKRRFRTASRDLVGFDIVLEQLVAQISGAT